MANQDQENVAIQIEAKLDNNNEVLLPTTSECCIYKVPNKLRKLNPDAYTPKIVSIGPFHHENTQLLTMDQKLTYCQKFIERSKASVDVLMKHVKELEPRVRGCYSKNIGLGREKFKELILVDCCFILEFLLGDHSKKNDTSIASWSLKVDKVDILWDLLLIENQLPFFVFEEIYNLAFKSHLASGKQQSFWKLACKWCSHNIEGEEVELQRPTDVSIAHFTDLYRYYRLQLSVRNLPKRGLKSLDHLYNVTELKEAGVKFMENEESKYFLDLKFQKPYLKIPQFRVTHRTEMILRNMVIFEQYHYPKESYFIDYIEFLDCLVNTKEDVDILIKNEIIVNRLGDSNAVAKMINGLCKNVEQRNSNTNYLRICRNLNAYYKHPRHRRMETLRRDYFNNPWMALASTAAFVLLILTIIQTICSIVQVA